jgi:hypothetical protein
MSKDGTLTCDWRDRPGASGKSTILKQMKLIHTNGFTSDELEFYRQLIFKNIGEGISTTLDLMKEWEIAFTNVINNVSRLSSPLFHVASHLDVNIGLYNNV